MHHRWGPILARAYGEQLSDLLGEAQAELDAWIRRPLAPDTAETLEDLYARIVEDGWGVTASECARAMRCTPTLVRRARLAAGRHPENGYHLPGAGTDVYVWACSLDAAGLTVRQIALVTGLPKSTLHDHLSGPRRPDRRRGKAAGGVH